VSNCKCSRADIEPPTPDGKRQTHSNCGAENHQTVLALCTTVPRLHAHTSPLDAPGPGVRQGHHGVRRGPGHHRHAIRGGGHRKHRGKPPRVPPGRGGHQLWWFSVGSMVVQWWFSCGSTANHWWFSGESVRCFGHIREFVWVVSHLNCPHLRGIKAE